MAQEIVTWCDPHLENDEYVKGTTHYLSLAAQRKQPRAVDVCDDCWKEIVGPVQELLDLHGRSPQAPPKAAAAGTSAKTAATPDPDKVLLKCPVADCPDEDNVWQERSSVRDHVEKVHGDDLAAVEGRQGHTVDGRKIVVRCQVKGCDAGFANPHGRGAHVRFRHPELKGK